MRGELLGGECLKERLLAIGMSSNVNKVKPDPSQRFFGNVYQSLWGTGTVTPNLGLAPVATVVVSLLSVIITTIVSFRKEGREARSAVLDNQKRELEIEKLRVELNSLKEELRAPTEKEKSKSQK